MPESNLDAAVLGETTNQFNLTTSEEQRLASVALVSQAKRSLLVHSRQLDPPLFDVPAFVDAVSRLARSGRHVEIRILVQDSLSVVQRGHRLISLAQQLTSYIKVRRPSETFRNYVPAFLVVDERGYIHRPNGDRFEGTACFNDPLRSQEIKRYFDQAWEHSQPDPNIRRLNI